jgi:hypothetical protein
MTVQRLSDSAFFVPPYYRRITDSHVPGIINHTLLLDDSQDSCEEIHQEEKELPEEKIIQDRKRQDKLRRH